jgi:bacterioferritin-associated ferredoxin
MRRLRAIADLRPECHVKSREPPQDPFCAMIVCSCNVLTKKRVVAAAEKLFDESPARAVTPGRILRELGVRAQCAVCFSLIRAIVAEAGVMVTCPEPLAASAEENEAAAAE